MRSFRNLTLVGALLMTSGCHHAAYDPPDGPMPPNAVQLSEVMRELSAQPGFTDSLIAQIDKGGKKGPALLTPALVDDLRKRIFGQDWKGLERFPGWTMHEINPTVRVVGHVAGKDATLEQASAAHPGAALSNDARNFLDIGSYALDARDALSLEEPSKLPAFTTDGIVTNLGSGVVRGDGPNPLAAEHAESLRLAYALNRLAANNLDNVQPFSVKRSWAAVIAQAGQRHEPRDKPAMDSWTPEDVIRDLQATGHTVTVTDSRYFANFAHLHYKGQDVMAPFWINTQIIIPKSGGRPLLVPVSHAEYEWHIRGPHVNADVSYYFGVDGKSQWRTMDTLDQAWVLKHDAHTYTGNDAVEVTRLAGLLTVAYMHLHAAHPAIPFGGYYAFGVCQDGVSAIEKKMTGKVTLFPNTADDAFFNDPRDLEVNQLIAAIPKDRDGSLPEVARIFGSLPVDGGAYSDFNAITIPGLAADLHTVHVAWTNGTLTHARSRLHTTLIVAGLMIVALIGVSIIRRRNINDHERYDSI